MICFLLFFVWLILILFARICICIIFDFHLVAWFSILLQGFVLGFLWFFFDVFLLIVLVNKKYDLQYRHIFWSAQTKKLYDRAFIHNALVNGIFNIRKFVLLFHNITNINIFVIHIEIKSICQSLLFCSCKWIFFYFIFNDLFWSFKRKRFVCICIICECYFKM